MLTKTLVPAALAAFTFGTAATAQTIVGGSAGNGDFQAQTTYAGNVANNVAAFDVTANWVNLGGSEGNAGGDPLDGPKFGTNNQLNLSPDPNHPPEQGAFLSSGNQAGNDTGYAASAGDVIDYSIWYAGTGGAANYAGTDEFITLFLFTAPAAVDGSTAFADINILASAMTAELAAGDNGTLAGAPHLVASNATIYLGVLLSNDTGGGIFPRVDLATMSVTPVPEPASLALLGLGGVALLGRRRA